MRSAAESNMCDWISDLLIFSAGVTGGILVSIIVSCLRANKQERADIVAARTRALDDMKEQRDQEILDAAFRTAEDIKGELQKSAVTLRKALLATVDQVPPAPDTAPERAARGDESAQPN
jgi:hypothetical protein